MFAPMGLRNTPQGQHLAVEVSTAHSGERTGQTQQNRVRKQGRGFAAGCGQIRQEGSSDGNCKLVQRFFDPPCFARVFHCETDLTPREYR